MPSPAYQDIPAYKVYASFASRPKLMPPWRKNKKGKFLVQSGELMCRYEVDGSICPNTTRFKSRQDLGRHIRDTHDTELVSYGPGQSGSRGSYSQKDNLSGYYAELVQIMRQDPLSVEPAPRNATLEDIRPNVPDDQLEEAEDDDQEHGDEEADADGTSPPPPSPPPATSPFNSRTRSYGITELPSFYNFLNPKPRSPSPPSRLPASLRPKFDLHADWDPVMLQKAKTEDAELIRRATDQSTDTSLAERIWKAREEGRERNRF